MNGKNHSSGKSLLQSSFVMSDEQATQQAIAALAQVHAECHQTIGILRHYGNCPTVKEKIRQQIVMLANALTVL